MADEQLLSLGARLSRRSFLKFTAATLSVASMGALLSACGDDEEEAEDEGGTGAESSTSTTGGGATGAGATTTTGTGDDDDDAEGTEEGDDDDDTGATGGGESHVVEMNDQLKFDPETITVKVGDSVTWTTTGAVPHTSTCDPTKASNEANISLPDGAEPWDSGNVNQGEEFSYTFEVAGEYKYICVPHELAGMVGTVVVEE